LLRNLVIILVSAIGILAGSVAGQQDLSLAGRILFQTTRDGNDEIYVMESDGSLQTRLTTNATGEQNPTWSPDGHEVVYQTDRDGNWEVYVMADDGSGETNLTNDASLDGSPSWSPDGSQIAFQTNRDGNFEIYVMDPDGSNPTRLTTDGADDLTPRFSPDGTQIVFQSLRDGDYEIYVMDVDGSNQTRLTTNAGSDELAEWSPDGNRIAWSTDRDGNYEIYTMDPDGTNQTRLTTDAGSDIQPSWTADGTKLVWKTDRDGNDEVYVMAIDGTGQTNLTSDAGGDAQSSAFQLRSIGKAVVGFPELLQYKLKNTGGVSLNVSAITSSDGQFTIDPTSANVGAAGEDVLEIVFAPTSGGSHAATLTFTSDDPDDPTVDLIVNGIGVDEPELQVVGDVVFTTDRDGDDEIYKMDLDGTSQTRLTTDAGADQFPSFSPDGGKVAWQTDRDGDFNVYVMNSDGTNVEALTTNVATDGEPSYSPDGSQIAFTTDRDGNFEVYVMFSDGTSLMNLTSDAGNDKHPRWSPDGSKIVFQTDRDGNEEIYSMDPDGSNQTRLTNDAGTDELAQFSPDGSQIAFASDRDGDFELFVMDSDGTNETQVTGNTANDTAPAWSPDGTRLMFATDLLGDFDVASMDVNGGKVFRLTDDAASDVDPDFSQIRTIGSVEVDSSQVRTVFVQNRGNSSLNISNITSSDGQFVLSTTTLAIAAFGEEQFDVTFTPTSTGFFTSDLTITSDDPETSTATLTINGDGFTPDPDLMIVTDLVYVSDRDGNDELYSQDLEGLTETRLTNDAGTDTDPHVSPEGAKIAFSTDRDGNFEIYTIDADGSNATRLTNDAGTDAFAAWSPTGAQITWQTNRDGNDEIYVMDADGSNPTNITNDAGGDLHPRWSSDGAQIVFHTDRDGNNEIYVMDSDGSNVTRLTNDAGSDREPDWSPDDSQIAFVSNRDGNDEIYVIDADGSNPTRMTNDAGTDESPTWSPGGSKIAFRSDRDGDGEIFILTEDGSQVFQFLFNANEERVPSWGNARFVGESPAGVPISRSLRIFNPGIGNLIVSNLTSSDPQVTFSPSSFVVADGEGQTVNVTYGPTSSTTIYPTITVSSNDTDTPVSNLTFAAVGLASGGLPTVVVDDTPIDFDSTAVGTTATFPIAVKNQGAGLLNVTSISVAGNGFSPSISGPATVIVGDSLVVDINFSPEVVGLLVGEVSIFHDDSGNTSPVVISVKGSGVDAIPVPSFSELDFGDVEVGKGNAIQMTVSNLGNIPILIHNVDPDSGVFSGSPDSVEVAIGQNFGVIDVNFAPDSAIAFVDTLRVYHNGSNSPLKIPLFGTGTPEPPPPEPILAFGLVNVSTGILQIGTTIPIPIDISNTGDDTLRVTDITTDLVGLTFTTTAFELPPGSDSTVVADFTPASVGPFEGTISVTHNGADSPGQVSVDGEVVAPEVGFTDAEVDFGPVQTGTTPVLDATIINGSPSDLEVTGVGVDGPFTVDASPFTLAAGEEKTIPISFVPVGPGVLEGVLRLFHDDPFVGPLEVPLRAEVLGEAFETGPSELFMVNPGTGKTARDTLAFSNLTDSTLTVSATASDGRFAVAPASVGVPAGQTQDFVITFTSDGSGKVHAELMLDHNAPGSPVVVVPLIVENGEAEIVFGLDNLQFETVDIGDTSSATVSVSNPGSDTLNVAGVSGAAGPTDLFQVVPPMFAIAPGESLHVTVQFIPDGPGSFTDFLTFEANVGLGQDLPALPGVSAIGTGRGPAIAVAPDRLFFATQDVGVPDSQTVVVTNVGNDTLKVSGVSTFTDLFVADAATFSLGEGESKDLLVVYTPDSSVARVDTLVLATNAEDLRIPLEANEIPKNIGKATLTLTRLDSLMSPQVGDTISLALDLMPGGDTVIGVDAFVGVPSAFFAVVNPQTPFTKDGLTESAFVFVNELEADTERDRVIAGLSTSLFTPRTADATVARLDLVVIAPLEGPAPVSVLSEFPVHNSQYLVSSPAGQSFTFQASEPEAFGNLPPRFLSLPLLETEEDGSIELFMNSRVIDPDGPLSEIAFSFEPNDTLFGVAVQTIFDSLVTAVFFPPADANGIFPITVIATDAGGAADTAVVLVDVAPANDPPTAAIDTVLVRGGGFVTIPLLNRATDIDGDSLGVTTVTEATNGQVILNEDDTATYTPESDFNGEASFSYVVEDGHGGAVTGTMVLTVSGTNARPVIAELPMLSGVVDSPFAFSLTEFKSDPDDSVAVLAWGVDVLSGPAESARVEGDLLEVFPLPGRMGEVRLLLALFDPFGAVAAREVAVRIDPLTGLGDFNGDFRVDFFDLIIFTGAWATVDGDERYVPLADLDSDGMITLADFQAFVLVFGTGW
jgi:Tol biopolymer transport system component